METKIIAMTKGNMFILLTIIIGTMLIGCSTAYKTEPEMFWGAYVKKFRYKLELPKGYERHDLSFGEGGLGYFVYRYPDSVVFYVAEKDVITVNYDNIQNNASKKDLMRRFPGIRQFLMTSDTITIEGKDRKNRYWKEVTYRLYNDDYYSFGYINVKESDLDKFNKVIDNVKIKCEFNEEEIAADRPFSTDSTFQELLKSLEASKENLK